jgi:hypothetical protein
MLKTVRKGGKKGSQGKGNIRFVTVGVDLLSVQTHRQSAVIAAVWKGTLYTACGTGLLFICTVAV